MTEAIQEKLKTLNKKEMGRRVRSRREAKNMSRENLAEKLGVSPQFVADIEYGNKGVSINNLYLLCQILNVTADYLLAGNLYMADLDSEAARVCEEIMSLLRKCDAKQLDGIRSIAEIYADNIGEQK